MGRLLDGASGLVFMRGNEIDFRPDLVLAGAAVHVLTQGNFVVFFPSVVHHTLGDPSRIHTHARGM
jgi:hypothetical protein